jgi:hypothetical protein
MSAESKSPQPKIDGGIPVKDLRQELRNWWLAKRLVATDFKEDTNPQNAPYDHYRLVYIAKFVPKSERQASLEIRLSDHGVVGIGVDARQRVARILKVRNYRQGFVDGFELGYVGIDEVLLLLNLVSGGHLTIRARVIPIFGLARPSVVFNLDRERANARIFKKFYFSRSLNSGIMTRTLTCDAWQ